MESTKERQTFTSTTACNGYHFNSHRARLKRQKNSKLEAFFMLACIIFIRAITTRSEKRVGGSFSSDPHLQRPKQATFAEKIHKRRFQIKAVQKRSEDLRLTTTKNFQLRWEECEGEELTSRRWATNGGCDKKWKLVEKLFLSLLLSPFPSPRNLGEHKTSRIIFFRIFFFGEAFVAWAKVLPNIHFTFFAGIYIGTEYGMLPYVFRSARVRV